MSTPERRRSRSTAGNTDAPVLRRRLCRGDAPPGDGVSSLERWRGLSATEWQRLCGCAVRKPISMSDFQRMTLEGKLDDHFPSKELQKIAMELRDILQSRGELRMATELPVRKRKSDVAQAVAVALKSLEFGERQPLSRDFLATGGLPGGGCSSLRAMPEQMPMESVSLQSALHSPENDLCLFRVSPSSSYNRRPLVHQASPPRILPDRVAGPSSALETGACEEVLLMNKSCSPFCRVVNVAKRFQLRYGSIPLRFEIPVQFVDAVVSRRMRVQLTPFRHPAIPARWPTAKDIAVSVNDQSVLTPWKRSWPERRVEVAKTFLFLDITQFLNRNSPFQKLQIDVFSREYFSTAAVMIVQPVSAEEVMGEIVKPLHSPMEETRDSLAFDLYRKVTEDEDALSGEVEIDDPVITSKCPILQTRINIPIRGSRCQHLQCFDCQSFLLSCNKGCYWNCPLCDAELRPQDVVVDTVLWRYLQEMGGKCPPHLRLRSKISSGARKTQSGDEEEKEKEMGGGGASDASPPFSWAPHRMANDDRDVILDSDDDDQCDNDAEDAGVNATSAPQSSQAVVKEEGGGGNRAALGNLSKRDAEHFRILGTAECPIEL